MPRNIMCAVDGSHAGEHAATCAAELAKQIGAKLTFVHVNTVPADRMANAYFWDETLISAANGQVNSQFVQAKDAAGRQELLNYEFVVVTGSKVAAAIVNYAKDKGFDHIVMGTGVTSQLERIFLGSVATDVVSQAHCPVTIVR
ncbi:universal stress protein [Paraburkholderia sacchari]|uniref:Universal stress protein n=1 Tax=Paraburkholderia sacchari TaxID=159450 RepID=A0A8T6ZDP7_9BURK|nr:universal stress protein [Paraburkholderia sacchari]NLP62742.1 universal stress protein [Paraburkholderia sacchari]